MGADRTGDTAGQTRWASARGERPRSSERDLLCALDGLPVAGVAEGSAAEEHPRILISCCGIGTARWSASITRSMLRPASGKDAKRARRLRSSTARAPRALKKGLRA